VTLGAGGRFDPTVFARPAFAGVRSLALGLGDGPGWPSIVDLNGALAGRAGVRFVAPLPRRRRGAPVDLSSVYDACIVERGEVPTRACWHDLANALVWARFPRAKRALHARQLRAIRARVPAHATSLPNARTDEQDALAMLDEGGLVVCSDADARLARLPDLVATGAATVHVFGHALLEHEAEGRPADVLAAVAWVREADVDRALAERLDRGQFPMNRRDLGSAWLREVCATSKPALRARRPASSLWDEWPTRPRLRGSRP